jgi:hypothetical protein
VRVQAKLSPLLAAAEVKFKDLRCFFREFAAKHNLHGAAGSATGPGARRVVIPVHIDGSTLFHFTAYAATADTLDKAGTAFIDEDVDAVKAVTAALWTGPRGLLRTFFGALDTSTLDSCFEFVFYLEGASSKYVNTTHSRLTFTYAVLIILVHALLTQPLAFPVLFFYCLICGIAQFPLEARRRPCLDCP